MFQHVVGNVLALLAQMSDSPAEINGIPMHDGTDYQVEPGSPERLTVVG